MDLDSGEAPRRRTRATTTRSWLRRELRRRWEPWDYLVFWLLVVLLLAGAILLGI